MPNLTIQCPCCHEEFPLSSELLTSVRAELSDEITAQVKMREEELQTRAKEIQQEATALAQEKSALKSEIDKQVAEQVKNRERIVQDELLKVQSQKEELVQAQANLQDKVSEQVTAQLKEKESQIVKNAERKAQQEAEASLKEKDDLLAQKESALQNAKEKELAFIKQEQELKEKEADIELHIARTLQQEREKITMATREKADEEYNLRVAEKEKTITELNQKLQEALRKAELGSQQGQGEVLELQLEDHLRQTYPLDTISPIKTGQNGADISLYVESATASEGKHLLFELKNTQNWQPKWVTKLKDDMHAARANQGIIITRSLPQGIKGFGILDGVWVSDFHSAKSLIPTLRAYLIEVHRARGLQEGAQDKAKELYDYITSDSFRQRVFQINDHFQHIRSEMQAERNYMEKKWAKRETHIQQILGNLNGITGTTEALTHTAIAIEAQG